MIRSKVIPPPTIFGYINLVNQLTVWFLCLKNAEIMEILSKYLDLINHMIIWFLVVR